jgi:Cytotoxic
MARKPKPSPCFLDQMESLGEVGGDKRWRNADGSRIYTWDSLHGEIEVYNSRGRHLGVLDAVTGELIKDAVRGRKIRV